MEHLIIVPLIYAAFTTLCGLAYYHGWAESKVPVMTEPYSKERKAVLKFALATSALSVFAAIAAALS